MKQIFLFLFTVNTFTLTSQILEISDKPLDVAIFTVNLMNNSYDSAIGTPYINESFLPAKINNGTTTQFVRFNCVEDQVEIKQGKTKILLLDLAKNQKIELSDGSKKLYHIYKFKDKVQKSRVTFLELIKDGSQYKLYKKERKKLIPKQNAEGYREAKPEEFISLSSIYFISDFQSKGDVLHEIPSKKKKFYSFFAKKRKKLENFIKLENLDYQKSDDLIKIIDFYFEKTI